MAQPNYDLSCSDESRRILSTPASTNMKLHQILRRGSAVDASEKQKEKDFRRTSIPESERKSSLSTLPLRLRRRRTHQTNEYTEEEVEAAEKLGQLLFALPNEILTEIITYFNISDIYSLRLASRSFNVILNHNASAIARPVLSQTLAPTTTDHIQPSLYPPPTSSITLNHLLSTTRRHHIVNQQIYNLLAFVQMKIYMTRTATRVLSVSDNRARLIQAFHRPAWFLMHFLEHYRTILVQQHPHHATVNSSSCHSCKDAARCIVATYPDADIVPTYHFYQLAMEHLHLATREPMSAGPLERRLRGWKKAAMTEENLAIFVILGGMQELRKVAMMQGSFPSRSGFVVEFVDQVRNAVAVNTRSKERGEYLDSREQTCDSDLISSLSPPFHLLTQDHIRSLPDVTRFFYDIWKDRIQQCVVEGEDIAEPYSWLQRVMSGSGLQFGRSRIPEPSLALGASPV